MATLGTLKQRNSEFAANRFPPGLTLVPRLKTFLSGCVDPRVDPAQILGDAAMIRNVGGRVSPKAVEELVMLRKVRGRRR